VLVIFDDNGEVSEIKLMRSPHTDFSKNAVKACEAMKTWNWKSEISEISESRMYQFTLPLRFKCGEKVE